MRSAQKDPKRHLKRNIPALYSFMFLSCLLFFFPIAILAFQEITGSYALAMAVFGAINLAQVVMELPTGILSDKRGRRETLIFGSVVQFVGILLYALAYSAKHPLLFLFAGSFFYGTSWACYSGNNNALAYETLSYFRKTHNVPKVMGRSFLLSGGLGRLCRPNLYFYMVRAKL